MRQLQEILFDVKKVETKSILPMYATNSENEFAIIGKFKDNSEKILNFCAERYTLMDNSRIYPELEKLFTSNQSTKDFTRIVRSKEDALFDVNYSFPKVKGLVGNSKDGLIAGANIGNSYNGKRVLTGSIFANRLVCTNGLWGVGSILDVKNRHTDIVEVAVQRLFIEILESINTFSRQIEQFNLLASSTVLDWQSKTIEIAEKTGIKKFHADAISIIKNESNEFYGGVVNDWLIYNGLNQIITKDVYNKKTTEVRQSIDKKLYANILATI